MKQFISKTNLVVYLDSSSNPCQLRDKWLLIGLFKRMSLPRDFTHQCLDYNYRTLSSPHYCYRWTKPGLNS